MRTIKTALKTAKWLVIADLVVGVVAGVVMAIGLLR